MVAFKRGWVSELSVGDFVFGWAKVDNYIMESTRRFIIHQSTGRETFFGVTRVPYRTECRSGSTRGLYFTECRLCSSVRVSVDIF